MNPSDAKPARCRLGVLMMKGLDSYAHIEGGQDEELMPRRETFLHYTLSRICKSLAPDVLVEAQRRQVLETLIARDFRSGNSLTYAALVIIDKVLDRAVQLVVLGQNAAVYIELHSALESYVTRALPRALGKSSSAASVVAALIARRSLQDLAPHLVTIGRWNKADLDFVRRLVRIRNAVAHRNEEALRKLLGPRADASDPAPLARLNEIDASVDLMRTLKLMIKATRFTRKSRPRVPGKQPTRRAT